MQFSTIIPFVAALFAGLLSFGVAFQQRRSAGHWFFSLGMFILAAEAFCAGMTAESTSSPELVCYWQNWRLTACGLLPVAWVGFSYVYARGLSPQTLARWRWGIVVYAVCFIFLLALFGADFVLPVKSADAQTWQLRLTLQGNIIYLLLLLSSILVLLNLERTFRAAIGTMRWRIKFMVIGLFVLFTVRTYTSSQALLFRGIDLSLQVLSATALLVACLLTLRSLSRSGHFEVSVYPSQYVLHHSLTILLAGIYLFTVGVLAKAASFLGPNVSFQTKALVVLLSLVLLAVLLLSDRFRLFTKKIVSRHFQRPFYDYRTVWRTFTEGTARRVDQGELCSAITKLVSDLFQCLSVTVWVVDSRKENLLFAASTSLSGIKPGEGKLDTAQAQEALAALSRTEQPIDIDAAREPWAVALRKLQPEQFRNGGNRVCVPMMSSGELIGVLVLGDRVGGALFNLQDLDLLKSVSDQAAASLLNIQLAQKLSQAKQLEAFQAMSAFFVHDLKNTASTLSLMLQNLPVHYNDPQFREDALRGISKTVTHINELINRLSVLRHELAIKPAECDLNELVLENLKTHEQAPGIAFEKDLQPLPKMKLDPAQVGKVLTNLLLNAREAVAGGGCIRVQTSRRNGWAVIEVKDNGCGMTPDFINQRLFRPFETTKKKGIGIGMFHCKMIVEAHHGRIEVESDAGKGTAFRVLFPLT